MVEVFKKFLFMLSSKENPFKDSFVNNEWVNNPNIMQMANDPEIVLRDDYLNYEFEGVDWRDRLRHYKKAKVMLGDLSAHYGIKIPPFDFVVAKNSRGEKRILTVTKKVHGEDLLTALRKDQNFKVFKEAKALVNRLLAYFEDVLQKGGEYFNDIQTPRQYKYGATVDDSEESIYLIDFEPRMSVVGTKGAGFADSAIFKSKLRDLKHFIVSIENISGAALSEEMQKVERLLSARIS